MPSCLSTSSMVSGTKDKKSHGQKKCKKPCESSSSSSCCTEQCIDCCSSQFLRLNRFATMVAESVVENNWNVGAISGYTSTVGTNTYVTTYNRSGTVIPAPNTSGSNSTAGGVTGAYANEVGCSGATGDLNVPVSLDQGSTSSVALYPIAVNAYYFVNQLAYGPYEPGCHNDQLYGWYVNLSTGQLQLFTQFEGVPTNATRACLSADLTVTSAQKRQLKVLNKLYKLSKSAVKEVNGIPKPEGNIVEVCDCKGERWLLYVNLVAPPSTGSPLSVSNFQFVVVASKLC